MYYRLILMLTLGALVEGIADILNLVVFENEEKSNYNALCYTQGVLIQISQNTIFSWTTVIAVNLFIVVCSKKVTDNLELVFHGVVWTWILFVTLIPLASNAYGPAGVWCWLTKSEGQPYRWAVFYGPLIVQVIVISVLYIMVIKSIRERLVVVTDGDNNALAKETMNRLKLYPIIFVVLYIFPLINRLYDVASTTDSFFLYVMQSITSPLYGFVVAIAYGLDKEIRNHWLNLFKTCLPCFVGKEKQDIEIDTSSDSVIEFPTEVSQSGM